MLYWLYTEPHFSHLQPWTDTLIKPVANSIGLTDVRHYVLYPYYQDRWRITQLVPWYTPYDNCILSLCLNL